MDSLKFKQERATIIENMEALVSQAKEEKRDFILTAICRTINELARQGVIKIG